MRSVTPGCSSRAGGGRAPGSSSPPRPRDRSPPAAGAPGRSNNTSCFSASGAMQPTRRRLRLADVNAHIVCFLCRGYYVDATTVVECLHSFCKSCILRYLENNSFCPICDVQIQSDAERHLRRDKVLQSLVYKMVPDLYREEMKRRRDFYAQNPRLAARARPEERGTALDPMIFSPTEPFSLALQYYEGGGESESEAGSSRGGSAGPSSPATLADAETGSLNCHPPGSSSSTTTTATSGLPKRYLQCQAQVPVSVIKKFLRLKYELAPWLTVELRHKKEVLTDDLTLMDVAYIYTWKRNDPLLLQYRFNDSRLVPAAAPSPNVTEANGEAAAAVVASDSQSPAQIGTNTKEHTKDAAQTEGHASEKTKSEMKGELAATAATMVSQPKDTASSSTNTKERTCAKDASRSAEETERGAAPTPAATHPDPNLVKESVASDSSTESTKVEGKPSATATKDDSKDEPKDSSAPGGGVGGRRRPQQQQKQQPERVSETWVSSGDSSPTASSSGSTASSPSASPSSSRSSSPSGRRTARLALGRGGKRGRGRWRPTAALAALAAKRAATGDSAFAAAKKQAAEESPTEASPSPAASPVPSSPPPTVTSDIVSSSSAPSTADPPQPPSSTERNVAAVPSTVTLPANEEKRPATLVTSRKRPSESSGVGPEEKRTRRVPPMPALVTILPVSASAVVAARRRLAQGPTSQIPPRQTQSPLPSITPTPHQQPPSLGNASKESGGDANVSVPDSSSPSCTPSSAPPTAATTASVSSQTPVAGRVVKREVLGGKSPRREGVRSPPPAPLPSPKRLRSYSHYPMPSSAPAPSAPAPAPHPVKSPTVTAAQSVPEVLKSTAGARPPLVRTLDGFRSPPPNSSERARASVEAVTRTSEEPSTHTKNSSAASVKTLAVRDGDSSGTAAQAATSKAHAVSEATNDSIVKKATNESSKQETDSAVKSTLTSGNVSAPQKSDNKSHSSAENKPGILSCERENNVRSEGETKPGNSLASNANESKDSRLTTQPDSKKLVPKVNQTSKDTGEADKKMGSTFKDEKKPAAVSKDARPLQSGKANETKSCSVPSSKISDNNPLAITFRLPPGSTIEPVAAGSGRRSSVATAKDTLTVRPHPGNQSSKSSGSTSAGSSAKNPIRPAQNTIVQRLSTSSSSSGASGDPKKPMATTNDNKKPVGSQQVPKDPARPLKMDVAGSRSPISPGSSHNNPVRSPAGAPPSPAPHRSPSQAPPRPPTPASRPSPASTPNSMWQSNKESRSSAGTNGPVRTPTSTSATPAAESAPTPARPSSASATVGGERRPGTPARPTAAPSPAPPAAHRPLSRQGQNGARPEDEAPPSSPGAVKSPSGVGPGPYARMTAPSRDSPAQSSAKVTFIPRLLQTPQPPPGTEEGARRPRGTNTAVRGRRRAGTGVLDLSSSATRPVPPRPQGIASIAQNLARRHLLNAAAAAAAAQRPTEAPLAHARPAPASSPAPPRSPAPPPRSPLPPPRSPLSSLSAFSMGFPRSPSPQGSTRPRQAVPPASMPSDLAAAARLDQGAAPALLQHRFEWAAAAAAAAAAAGRGGEQLQRCLESLGVPNAAAASPFLQYAAAAAASSGGHPGGGGGGGGAGRGAGAFRK